MDERTVVVKAQQRLQAPVQAAVLANRCGVMDAVLSSAAADVLTDGIGGRGVPKDQVRQQRRPPVQLPLAFLLAVTAARIHVFAVRMAFGRLRVKQELAVLDRAGLQGAVRQGPISTVFRLQEPGQGSGLSFEIMTSDYARDFAAALGLPVEGADPDAPRQPDRRRFWRWVNRVLGTLLLLFFVGAAVFTGWYFFYGTGPAQ
jgi:hypothetical protein